MSLQVPAQQVLCVYYDEDMLPEPDIEFRIAHALLGSTNPLDRQIVESLVGRPKRYSELKPLLKKKADNNLTMALARLVRDGLVAQLVDARARPLVKSYQLTALGILVIFRMNQMLPVHESVEAYLRGRAASKT